MTQEFIPGQRWFNTTESQLGLGTVLSADRRTVTLLFLATGETRTYSQQSAPLIRVAFAKGERVHSHDGIQFIVQSVETSNGLITYIGTDPNNKPLSLHEDQLDHYMQMNRPLDRLFSGQIDPDRWLSLRYKTLVHSNRLAHSDLRGLIGCRTRLIPHQLYVAHEIAKRYAPRVLLADEVGLGKTIEAGLIVHQQLLSERAKRILIICPESLLHQWLVELLRRFNLKFSIFDVSRCEASVQENSQENPFQSEQLILCSLEFLTENPHYAQFSYHGDWDIVIVDEAHHLQWTPNHASQEYQTIAALASQTKGLLLLTATPEQLGKAGHYARLHLLDPHRFSDFDRFIEEERRYQPVAAAIKSLLESKKLSTRERQLIESTLIDENHKSALAQLDSQRLTPQQTSDALKEIIEQLLDRHGTGRVLIRNTRAAIKGFPERQLIATALPTPDDYNQCFQVCTDETDIRLFLSPELLYQSQADSGQAHWCKLDPRTDWLINLLSQLKPQKILVITANAQTALDLSEYLRIRTGIQAAIFHEGLSIIERDRAGAFFANQENGSQVLICSEIGSEGRNFQFAQHLVLFDLPLKPDQLEQRIGRLDRIGQLNTVQIYVPYLENSPQAVIFRWYHEGLDAFEKICPAGQTIFTQYKTQLLDTLTQNSGNIDALIEQTRSDTEKLNQALREGRDQLLEYNSCQPNIANTLTANAIKEDEQSNLKEYMDQIFDCFGVISDIHSSHCYVLHPGNHMATAFPGLPDDGITVTFDRNTALENEDIQYLSWEHPMVDAAMERIQTSEIGNAAVTATKIENIAPGTLILECVYLLEPTRSNDIATHHFLPLEIFRIVIDHNGKILSNALSHDKIRSHNIEIDTEIALKIVRASEPQIKKIISQSELLAESMASDAKIHAMKRASTSMGKEINRLTALAQINPNVRQEEIDHAEKYASILQKTIQSTRLRLDAIRVIVATE